MNDQDLKGYVSLFFGFNGLVVAVGTVIGNLWGNRKERTIAAKTAAEEARIAADEVRKDIQAELALSREENRQMRAEQKADWERFEQERKVERLQFDLERKEMVQGFTKMEIEAERARGALELEKERVTSLRIQMEAQQRQIETLQNLVRELQSRNQNQGNSSQAA